MDTKKIKAIISTFNTYSNKWKIENATLINFNMIICDAVNKIDNGLISCYIFDTKLKNCDTRINIMKSLEMIEDYNKTNIPFLEIIYYEIFQDVLFLMSPKVDKNFLTEESLKPSIIDFKKTFISLLVFSLEKKIFISSDFILQQFYKRKDNKITFNSLYLFDSNCPIKSENYIEYCILKFNYMIRNFNLEKKPDLMELYKKHGLQNILKILNFEKEVLPLETKNKETQTKTETATSTQTEFITEEDNEYIYVIKK